MVATAELNAAPSNDSPAIIFPAVTAEKWMLPNGLTIIVQTDRSAPVVSVQAWCAAGSIDEGQHQVDAVIRADKTMIGDDGNDCIRIDLCGRIFYLPHHLIERLQGFIALFAEG